MKTIIELKRTTSGWRWTMRDYRNRKIIGASTEGYRRRIDAVGNLERLSGTYMDIAGRAFFDSKGDVREVVES